MFAVLGWLLLGGLAIAGWVLYQKATKPGEVETRTGAQLQNPQGRPYSPAVWDRNVNHGLPLSGQADLRPARDVIGWWAIASGVLPTGAHEMRDQYDIDIGGIDHGRETVQVGVSGEIGGFWRPAFAVLRSKLEKKMIDEVNSGFPANPPNPQDMSTRSLRMDVRQKMWIAAGREEGLPVNLGFADWRYAVQARGSRSRGDALRTRLEVLRGQTSVSGSGGTTVDGRVRVGVR